MASEETNIQVSRFVEANGVCTKKQIVDYVSKIVTNVKNETISKTIDKLTVNHDRRVNYSLNWNERLTNENNKADKLYKINNEYYVSYNQKEHGIWQIYSEIINGKIKWLTREIIQDEAQRLQGEFDEAIRESFNLAPEERKKRLKEINSTIPVTRRVLAIVFVRSPDVVAEVLHRAMGNCEKCHKPAPFHRSKDNTPYLEVHHIIPLSKGGEDTIENAIAVCPNCHRQAHFG
ncbi:HNH endonuclease [Enterobacter sp. JS8-1]|uniref:HNH endonuclease n=1 Tax=Enterobacter sp. JS8-1 TaxID=3411633 RepID=UPI003BA0CF41